MGLKQILRNFWDDKNHDDLHAEQLSNIRKELATIKNEIDQSPKIINLPPGRISQPNNSNNGIILSQQNKNIIYPSFIREEIAYIRRMSITNGDVGQVIHNIITLGNTGHKILFDRKAEPEYVDKMRNHLINKRTEWAMGCAGMDGVVNKMFAQLLIGGALSTEWVPNIRLKGIQRIIFVNPDDIYFEEKNNGMGYKPLQKISHPLRSKANKALDFIPLNPKTYKYFGLNGDTDSPYGFPPYASVRPRLETQANMNKNIDFVVDQLGIVGFLEALMAKPDKIDGETDAQYTTRLDSILTSLKKVTMMGIKDGVVAGFDGDHTFKFNSLAKDYDKVNVLYKNNELQIATSLKQDASLWGRDYNTSESQITVVFMKMLSELRNIQNIIKANLEFGYTMELLMAGFKFENLKVQFNRSTIQDDLKYQQAEEIKIRNVKDKLILGVIDQDQMADELGYEAPAEITPLIPYEVLAGGALQTDQTKKKKDAADTKDSNDRKNRKKEKATPKDK